VKTPCSSTGPPSATRNAPSGCSTSWRFSSARSSIGCSPTRAAGSPSRRSTGSKLGKIVGKQQVAADVYQLTLHDGQTLRTEEASYTPKDSLVVDNETDEVVAHFPYQADALVTAVDGSHAGEIGEIETITVTASSSSNNVRVSTEESSFETIEEYVVVIDENFTAEETEVSDA